MKAKSRPTGFDHTAAGIYAKAMERALSATYTPQQPVKLDTVKRTMLVGGCLLYSVSTHCWRKG